MGSGTVGESLIEARRQIHYTIEVRSPVGEWQLWNTPDSGHAERTFESICDGHPGLRFRLVLKTISEEVIRDSA